MPQPIQHILALAPNWLGDAAMATPALRALHRRYPDARLSVAGRKAVCDLLDGLPWIHTCHELPTRPGLREQWKRARMLAPADLCVVFPHSFRAAVLARMTGASKRLGQSRNGRAWLLTDTVPPPRENGRVRPIYMGHEYLQLLAPLGCKDDDAGLELHADEALRREVRQQLAGSGPLVAIAPGAAFGPSKCWPAERYAAVMDQLTRDHGARCVLCTGPGETNTRDAVIDATQVPVLELEGPSSIARLKAVLAEADLLIGNDSGPRHVAIAFGTPVVCIMGSTSPRYSEGPWEKGRVLRVEVDCGPCQKPVCTTDHRCMTRIAPETVVATALAYLPR